MSRFNRAYYRPRALRVSLTSAKRSLVVPSAQLRGDHISSTNLRASTHTHSTRPHSTRQSSSEHGNGNEPNLFKRTKRREEISHDPCSLQIMAAFQLQAVLNS